MRSITRSSLLNLTAYAVMLGSAVSSMLQIERILQRWLVLLLLLVRIPPIKRALINLRTEIQNRARRTNPV